uniref:HMG box domain-containing protein n=1 Tax=Heterorhabditis bacteriophora TaxID=37862 RepID=A0A1I7X3F5_HETBA
MMCWHIKLQDEHDNHAASWRQACAPRDSLWAKDERERRERKREMTSPELIYYIAKDYYSDL